MAHIVVIHGTMGSPDGNWFPWLKSALADKGFACDVPRMPTPDGQNVANWIDAFESQCRVTPETILVGHSMGAGFILHYLSNRSVRARAAFLLAPFIDYIGIAEYDRLNADFVKSALDWNKLRQFTHDWRCVAGDNDPYVPLALSQKVADNLHVPLQTVKNGGHLNSESGFNEFPLLLSMLGDILMG